MQLNNVYFGRVLVTTYVPRWDPQEGEYDIIVKVMPADPGLDPRGTCISVWRGVGRETYSLHFWKPTQERCLR